MALAPATINRTGGGHLIQIELRCLSWESGIEIKSHGSHSQGEVGTKEIQTWKTTGWLWAGEVEKAYLPSEDATEKSNSNLWSPREGVGKSWLQRTLQFLAPGCHDTQRVLLDFHPLSYPWGLRMNSTLMQKPVSYVFLIPVTKRTLKWWANSKIPESSGFRASHYLLDILPFSDIFIPDLHPWTTQAFEHFCRIQTHQVSSFVSH